MFAMITIVVELIMFHFSLFCCVYRSRCHCVEKCFAHQAFAWDCTDLLDIKKPESKYFSARIAIAEQYFPTQ